MMSKLEEQVYVVVRNGVYMQGIGGIFTSDTAAMAAADKLKALEPDDYHTFALVSIRLNEILDLRRRFDGRDE